MRPRSFAFFVVVVVLAVAIGTFLNEASHAVAATALGCKTSTTWGFITSYTKVWDCPQGTDFNFILNGAPLVVLVALTMLWGVFALGRPMTPARLILTLLVASNWTYLLYTLSGYGPETLTVVP